MGMNDLIGQVDVEIVSGIEDNNDIGIKIVTSEHIIISVKKERLYNILKSRKLCSGGLNIKLDEYVEQALQKLADHEDKRNTGI